MSLKFSTCLRNKRLGDAPVKYGATIGPVVTIAAVHGASDSYTDSGNGFVTAGFKVGDTIFVRGFTTEANNGIKTVTTVAAGTLGISGSGLTSENAGDSNTIVAIQGGSLKDIFKDSVLYIYSGAQPANADAAIVGTLLCIISLSSGTFVAGASANGLRFGTASGGIIDKASGDVWSGENIADGVAGSFRLCANPTDTGGVDSSFIYPRIDGTIAVAGGQAVLNNTTLKAGATTTVDQFQITDPE